MLPQIVDFTAEVDELDGVLARISERDFERTTAFKAWTINDVILHLHATDLTAMVSLRDPDAYRTLRAHVQARKAAGMTTRDEARDRFQALGGGHALRRIWRQGVDELCARLAARDPEDRIAWGGPDMGVRMFTTARQMETWSHGQEVFDVLGLDRVPTPRLRNIATIGVRTYGWTFANRQQSPPGDPPHVRLQGPSRDIWEWNPPQLQNSVTGCALEFCQVVTQVRNIADTQLVVTGAPANAWMQIAQCFAGPPEPPPAPGSRQRAATRIL